ETPIDAERHFWSESVRQAVSFLKACGLLGNIIKLIIPSK
ncbi:MAG: hypothetical protein ACI9XU_001934, partial [Arenicella sp.]